MELETAARRRLLTIPAVTGYAQQKVFKFRLEEPLDKTAGVAYVVTRQSGWQTPDPVRTMEYPILWIDCYADPSRDVAGNISANDAEDKALAAARVLKTSLHGVRDEWWGRTDGAGGLRVVACSWGGEPTLLRDKDRHDGTIPALGDVVIARTRFRLIVAP